MTLPRYVECFSEHTVVATRIAFMFKCPCSRALSTVTTNSLLLSGRFRQTLDSHTFCMPDSDFYARAFLTFRSFFVIRKVQLCDNNKVLPSVVRGIIVNPHSWSRVCTGRSVAALHIGVVWWYDI